MKIFSGIRYEDMRDIQGKIEISRAIYEYL